MTHPGRLTAVFLVLGILGCASAPVAVKPAARAPSAVPAPRLPVAAPVADPLDASVYRLASGDVVRIDVLGEPDLSMSSLIDPSGSINYPFLARVQASGLTVRQLEKQIRDGLRGGFLVNPDVRVGLAQYRPVFISGQVRQSGTYPYSLGLTVEKALTLAGGMTAYGSSSRIFIQRLGTGQEQRIRVGLDNVVYPGDTVIVEERLF